MTTVHPGSGPISALRKQSDKTHKKAVHYRAAGEVS